jgi:hypothetical protein
MPHPAITIRAVTPIDAQALARLVTLGPRPYLPGSPGLIAEVDGTAVAAIALTSGAIAADLDRANPRVVESLRYRRYQIVRQGGDVGRARHVIRRLAPTRRVIQKSPA